MVMERQPRPFDLINTHEIDGVLVWIDLKTSEVFGKHASYAFGEFCAFSKEKNYDPSLADHGAREFSRLTGLNAVDVLVELYVQRYVNGFSVKDLI